MHYFFFMREFIDEYKSSDLPVDIESIVSKIWLVIEYFPFDSINGFIHWRTIAINSNLSLSEQRFTIAHELWHYVDWEIWTSTGIFACTDFKEKVADQFAMDLLCPTDQLKELWEEYENIPTIAQCLVVPESIVIKKLKLIYP